MDADSSLTTCVRRFGKPKTPSGDSRRRRNEHITAYSGDAVYLYSTYDDPANEETTSSPSSPLLPSNDAKRRRVNGSEVQKTSELLGGGGMDVDVESSSSVFGSNITEHSSDDESHTEQEEDMSDGDDEDDEDSDYLELEYTTGKGNSGTEDLPTVSVVFPRQRYIGARNVATIKDVNFLGPSDEYVASGSDDGNFFIWRKATGALHGIYEGDGTVVNMIEGHPHLPLVAVSGIDHTVKLFAPSNDRPSKFSRIENAANIMQTNSRLNRPVIRYSFATLLAQARLQMDETGEECRNQ
ncbi:hypothetical protein H0H87_002607 [Tephrocybe sp. NHM501043]|nr:hypothetical protein H0H87_002607 [Tephrocybe sp. NHM501043]